MSVLDRLHREPMPARDALGRRVHAECDAMCARFVNTTPPTIRTALTDFATAKLGTERPRIYRYTILTCWRPQWYGKPLK